MNIFMGFKRCCKECGRDRIMELERMSEEEFKKFSEKFKRQTESSPIQQSLEFGFLYHPILSSSINFIISYTLVKLKHSFVSFLIYLNEGLTNSIIVFIIGFIGLEYLVWDKISEEGFHIKTQMDWVSHTPEKKEISGFPNEEIEG